MAYAVMPAGFAIMSYRFLFAAIGELRKLLWHERAS